MKPDKINRAVLPNSIFEMRGNEVKWPTIRKAWLTHASVHELEDHVTTKGRSIIFLDGEYRTNLNQWAKKDPYERAVFFEYLVKHPKINGGIFLLSWIGNYHNGCIIHFAWQYPQIRCWLAAGKNAERFFERKAFQVYKECVEILYKHSDYPMDAEVENFIRHNS